MGEWCLVQMTVADSELLSLDHYIKKTYFKTGSLMANSCRAVALLGGHPEHVCDLSWQYGRHLGLAFQVQNTTNIYCLRLVI